MSHFLQNCWYVACSADEMSGKPFRRIILDVPIVLYRLEDGTPVALHDRCPHRLVPLSLGKLVGDHIQCIYHGLQFDRNGTCVHNPHSGAAAARIRVPSFPLAEKYGYLWIWMGEPDRADRETLPQLDFLEDHANFKTVRGYLKVNANYQLISDNLLDLSHVEFLHPMFAREEGVESHRTEFLQEQDAVIANRWKPNTTLNGFAKLLWENPPERGDGRANMRWMPPSNLLFDLGVCHLGAPIETGLCTPATHLLTPETLYTTHYFWSQGRNRRLDEPQLDQQILEVNGRVFECEDRVVIEAQQAQLGLETDILKVKPLLLKIDTPAIMARRVMSRLIEQEAAQATAAPLLV